MEAKIKLWLVLSLLLAANCMQHYCVHAEALVPCLFAFGDSLTDCGNNNNRATLGRANFIPYGIDFPQGPTGRFTNGRTSFDFISELLGFQKFIPPHADTSGSDILKGVNYASGGAGIRPESGMVGGDNIDLENQVSNHRAIFSEISEKLGGSENATEYLNKCLYYVNIGTNDYLFNYFFFPIYLTRLFYTPQQYADTLLVRLFKYIQELHDDFGARKFVVVGVADIGCIPATTHQTNGSCVEEMSDAVSIYNDKLKSRVDQFNNHSSTHSKSIFVPSLDRSIIPDFPVANAPCCPTPCLPNRTPCQNRSNYMFWDETHPSEAANRITAQRSSNDIMRLVQSSIQTTTP
ncbi:GDSL esterase/lipase At1g29660 isoform X1 [Vigna angularis]|uniref:GDSL esterase/lipase At1g29660 isoform X1 n=1 Tax=Phaseolus angularis TaxID=3914 RepID=UPI000809EF1B|nr:GDSL esterase/lipase At1g29660 isoform X1 [Vigna angularis]